MQIGFQAENKFLIYSKGKKTAEVDASGRYIPVIQRKNVSASYDFATLFTYTVHSIKTYNLKSLYGNVYMGKEGELIYIDKKGKYKTIDNDADSPILSKNGKLLFYVKSGNLYKTAVTGSPAPINLLAENVDRYDISSTGKCVYYFGEFNSLWMKKEGSQAIKISDNVSKFAVSSRDAVFYITGKNQTLYTVHNGKDSEQIAVFVQNMEVTPTAAYYYFQFEGPGFDIYASPGNTAFKLLAQNVSADYYY